MLKIIEPSVPNIPAQSRKATSFLRWGFQKPTARPKKHTPSDKPNATVIEKLLPPLRGAGIAKSKAIKASFVEAGYFFLNI